MTEVLERASTFTPSPVLPNGIRLEQEDPPLTERAVLLRLTITTWGVDRRLKDHQYHVNASKRMTRAGKKLLISPELKAIHSLDDRCRDWVASRGVPSQFRKGIYLQPIANLLEVEDYIAAYKLQRRELIEEFLAAYPRRIEEAKVELCSLFDPKNYPQAHRLRSRFKVRHAYLELVTAPDSLRFVSGELFAREQEKARRQWQEALEEARFVLRSQMAKLVEHMVDRLQPGPDGKRKTFHSTLVTGMAEWLSTFDARNLADDRELSELVQRARDLLRDEQGSPVTADDLKESAGLRERLQRSFSTIKERLDRLVIDRPARRILLED